MIDRTNAFSLINVYLKDDKIIKHSLAVEAIMIKLSKIFNENETLWSLVGLLHDLDYEYTKENPETHTKVTAELLDGIFPKDGVNAIQSHNYLYTEILPTSALDKTLLAADAVSGLIIATALVMPSKKISDVKIKTLIDKFNDKSFAKGCNRDRIKLCVDCNISLEEFLQLSLETMCNISDSLDL